MRVQKRWWGRPLVWEVGGEGEEGGRTLFTCISLFLSLSHFTSSSPPFLFDKIMKYTWLLLPTTFIEWWQRWDWQGPFIAGWPFVYAETFVGPVSQMLPSLACEDQKMMFYYCIGLNFHIHIVDVTGDLSGKLCFWCKKSLTRSRLQIKDVLWDIEESSQCLPVLAYVTHFETMSK